MTIRHASIPVVLLSALLLTAGCSTNMRNVFTGYSGQAGSFKNALSSGNPAAIADCEKNIEKDCKSKDKILYLQERGRLRSIKGDQTGSIADYQVASDFFEAERMKDPLSVANAFFNATALATNDLAIPYDGYGFEKVMLHNMQAINYLLADNYDFARIELNHADVEQVFSMEKHQKLVAEAEAKQNEKQFQLGDANTTLAAKSSQAVFGAGAVKNSFQNAFTFYLRGSLFEDSGDYDKALIEYKKALEIFQNNRFVAESAMRTARLCGASRDQTNLTNIFGNALKGEARPDGSGRLVIVYESGFIAKRSEFKIPFVWDNNIIQIVLPYYNMSDYRPADELDVLVAGAGTRTQTVCNLDAMAVRSLEEDYNAILIRQVLRMVAKYQIQKAASDNNAYLGWAVKLASILTDNADDRNWLTLPKEVQIAEIFVPAGKQEITCTSLSLTKNVTLDIQPGKTHFLFVSQFGSLLVARSKDMVEVIPPAPVAPEAVTATPTAETPAPAPESKDSDVTIKASINVK